MGDADINSQPSKKRAAGVQLTRDNTDLDDNEESSEMEAGTFKKASDEVLATRRIVKVRRQQVSTPAALAPAPSPASNPFAAIRLVPAASSAPPVADANSNKNNETDKTDASKPENKVDEPKGESAVEHEKSDDYDDCAKKSDSKIDDTKPEPDTVENDGNDASKQDKSEAVVEDLTKTAGADNSETVSTKGGEGNDKERENVEGVENTAAADTSETKSKKDDKKKENVEEVTGEKNPGTTASFGLFQQLSNSQNAFSGFSGTGFSSTPFSFGSVIKGSPSLGSATDSPFGRNSGPVFGLGSSNNGSSSIFGTTGTSSTKNEGNKFPPMLEVPVETGEENEKSIFTADSVLFEFTEGVWKERGKGEIKVNVPTTGSGKARLVMRAKGNYRLILNASLYPDMKLANMDKRGITFACMNTAAEGKEGLSTVALRFKDASVVENFQGVVAEHKAEVSTSQKTPENSPKTK